MHRLLAKHLDITIASWRASVHFQCVGGGVCVVCMHAGMHMGVYVGIGPVAVVRSPFVVRARGLASRSSLVRIHGGVTPTLDAMGELTRPLERALAELPACPLPVEDLLRRNVDCAGGWPAQAVLRHALRHKLDISIRPVVRSEDDDGAQQAMTNNEMKGVYTRRRDHIIGYKNVLQWAIVQCRKHMVSPTGGVPPALQTPPVAYAFWQATDGAPVMLPQCCREGLASCVANSGLTVVLLTYQVLDLGGVPPGVRVEDARSLLPWPIFAKLLHGEKKRVQHLADYVRFLALARGVSGLSPGGWLIDADTIWFRKAPTQSLSVVCPRCVGHFVACQHAAVQTRVGGTYLDKRGIVAHWKQFYLKTPGDFLHAAFPFAAPANSPVVVQMVCSIEVVLFGGVPGDAAPNTAHAYNIIMRQYQSAVLNWGLEGAIAAVSDVSPQHRLRAKEAGTKAKRHLFGNLSALFGRPLCTNNIWQSSMHATDGRVAFELADAVPEDGSAWHYVIQRAREVPLCRRVWWKSPAPKRACIEAACPQQHEATEKNTPTNEQQAVHQVEEQAADEQATERDEEPQDEDTAEEDYTEEEEEEDDSAACPSEDPLVAELNRRCVLIEGGCFLDDDCLAAECVCEDSDSECATGETDGVSAGG